MEVGLESKAKREGVSEDMRALGIGGLLILGVWGVAFIFPNLVFPRIDFSWSDAGGLLGKVLSWDQSYFLVFSGLLFGGLLGAVQVFSGGVSGTFVQQFVVIYLLAIASLVIAGQAGIDAWGIEYVLVALALGLVGSNLLGIHLAAVAQAEFYIKTGLVIMGSGMLFGDLLQAGVAGMLQALAVVGVVWIFSLWLSRKLGIDDEFGVILASAVSICGVSAAIVAAGAIQGDKKKLSYVTTLVLLVAIPMLIFQPWLAQLFEIPPLVAGAWLGGTLDTTASVAAATEILGPAATKVGIVVKFSQNVLIGVAAFFIATWWVLRKKPAQEADPVSKPGFGVIWERFPKFILGFLAAALVSSFFVPGEITSQTGAFLKSLQKIWFALAFVAIGLEARFAELWQLQGGKPALAFITAQFFNIAWTLLWAYLLFGGYLLDPPSIQ
jgi:uncharacterized membrane protein YadS